MQGEFCLAYLKISLTLDAPTPTNTSMNSAAEIDMNGTPASPLLLLQAKFFLFLAGHLTILLSVF
jgi:hypothetical protein